MAKTIKFNLICDKKPIRTIEDLQENFSIEDVLEYYKNKLLHRWLEVRGYSTYLDKVNGIESENTIEIVKSLIKIFEIEVNEQEIEKSVYVLNHINERKELCAIYDEQNYKVKAIIDDFETGYRELVEEIIMNPSDIALIKANINEIVTNYDILFRLNYRTLVRVLWYYLKEDAYLIVMCLLMNDKARRYYIPSGRMDDETAYVYTSFEDDTNATFKSICSCVNQADFKTKLGENLKCFSGATDGYWKDLEPKGKRYMIISIGSGDYVRSAGETGGDLGHSDIIDKFVIVDGVDYKSNSESRQLLYMEV